MKRAGMEGDAQAPGAIECSVAERERGCVAALPTDPVRRSCIRVGHGVRVVCPRSEFRAEVAQISLLSCVDQAPKFRATFAQFSIPTQVKSFVNNLCSQAPR